MNGPQFYVLCAVSLAGVLLNGGLFVYAAARWGKDDAK
jgi:hypothetical protein